MGPTEPPPLVRCRGVSRVYARTTGRGASAGPQVTAVDDVSLSIAPGVFLAVTGPSGSGKSTLLHLLGALDTPTSGTVEFDGTDVAGLDERERTRLRLERIGIVFQRFHLLPSLSARANVGLPLIEQGVTRGRRRARAGVMLERVGLADRMDHRPGELSGGERQRVAVARALVAEPDVIIADEPTGELDTATGEEIIQLLAGLADDRAVVVASHDPAIEAAAGRTVRLRDGRIAGGGDGGRG